MFELNSFFTNLYYAACSNCFSKYGDILGTCRSDNDADCICLDCTNILSTDYKSSGLGEDYVDTVNLTSADIYLLSSYGAIQGSAAEASGSNGSIKFIDMYLDQESLNWTLVPDDVEGVKKNKCDCFGDFKTIGRVFQTDFSGTYKCSMTTASEFPNQNSCSIAY